MAQRLTRFPRSMPTDRLTVLQAQLCFHMDLFFLKRQKRRTAALKVVQLLNRASVPEVATDSERRDDSRSRQLHARPVCLIPLGEAQEPLLDQRTTAYLDDLSGTGVGVFLPHEIDAPMFVLCMLDEGRTPQEADSALFVKIRIVRAEPCKTGGVRVAGEFCEEIHPKGPYEPLAGLFAAAQ